MPTINKNKQLTRWMKKRFPITTETTLTLRTIFIVPTITSLALLLTVFLLFLMAVNFQNSLVYALSFWLMALILVAILFTYRNLSGLTVRALQSSPCFAGEKAVFKLQVSCIKKQQKSAVFLGWKNEDITEVNLDNAQSREIKLSHSTTKRGWFMPPKVNIFSRHPIGLVIAWSYAALKMKSLVYPKPLLQDNAEYMQSKQGVSETGQERLNGSTDFAGIRQYQAGDSPKHIHWKTYAKTRALFTKSFVDYASHTLWLDWDSLNLTGIETKLSHLCARVLACYQEDLTYGLNIPSKILQPARGEAHKNACLTALALHGLDDDTEAKS
jgi:uncharacterized protein (DUF58 family)